MPIVTGFRKATDAAIAKVLDQQAGEGPACTIRDLGDGTYLLVKPMLFDWTLLRGRFGDRSGHLDRWCYRTEDLALQDLRDFPDTPGEAHQPQNWYFHPRSGARR